MNGRRSTARFTPVLLLPLNRRHSLQAVRWIAQLAGFLGRKHDGDPGVKTIWQGLRRLHDIAATWKLLRPDDPEPARSGTYG